jgi:hypothetical protein
MTQRTYCPKCQTFRFKEADQLCFHCARSSTVEVEQEAAPAVSESITFGGYEVDAPGFTPEQFVRAVARSLADDLAVSTDQAGATIVGLRSVNGGYHVTREGCTCKARQVGTPCKHRAALIAHLDIREPALRRQWAQLQRPAEGRKVVAA